MKRLLLFVLVLLAPAVLFAQEDPADAARTNVTYPAADGTTLRGYLARPSGSGPFPGVLMIHEWWGLNVDTTRLADALAEEGFVVLAPDAFRGSLAKTPQEAMAQLRSTPREQIASDLDSALEFLRSHSAVEEEIVATMGFCFGGTQSMHLGTRAEGLAAVVTLYGSGPIQEASRLGNLPENAPLLGIFGEEDDSIPLSEVRGFEEALQEADVEHTVTIYPGVGHAFVKSTTYDRGGAPEEAWNQLVSFLNSELK
ncbi:MAG: dienelactone hydrolase family protein [Alkalispirochaetaceae bacterium]